MAAGMCLARDPGAQCHEAAPQAWHVSRLTRVAILLLLVMLMLRRWHAIALCRPMLWAHGLRTVVSLHTIQTSSLSKQLPLLTMLPVSDTVHETHTAGCFHVQSCFL